MLPPEEFQPGRVWFFMAVNLLHIAFFYLNYGTLVSRLLLKNKRWHYFAAVGSTFLLIAGISLVLFNYMIPAPPGMAFYRTPGVFALLTTFGLVWAASSGIRLNAEWNRAETLRRESENARLKAELAQLKNQLNPHFLFNTLNGIYTLTLTKSDSAPQALLQLSFLLRYVIADSDADFVLLEKDLQHLRHFIDLHRMRLTDKTTVDFSMEGDATGKKIAPLLLLPFVENAFKYGSSVRENSPISILIKIENDSLEFHCRNLVRTGGIDSPGIGIANTRRRLDLLYPGRYGLNTTEYGGIYTIHLHLDL